MCVRYDDLKLHWFLFRFFLNYGCADKKYAYLFDQVPQKYWLFEGPIWNV